MASLAREAEIVGSRSFDLSRGTVRDLNQFLHHDLVTQRVSEVEVLHPGGAHAIAVGVNHPVRIEVRGHAGYYVGGMNKHARITVHGNVGWGAAENMMSGSVRVKGFASEAAGATAHGGLLVIEGDASLRCGISLKGADIVVRGNVGNFSAFMAQAGTLVVCGDAGDALGDSLYEAVIYVRGKIKSLGADAGVEPLTEADQGKLRLLLGQAEFGFQPSEFKRVASRRTLYHFDPDRHQEY